MRLLLAEDDLNLGEGLLEALQKEGFNVNLVSDGEAAQTFIESGLYDITILDIGLPIKTGLEVLKSVRSRGIKTPILLLTARDGLEDRVKGLDFGADDYMTKPFELKELVARVKAISRRIDVRSGKSVNEEIMFGDYSFNPSSETVTKDGVIIPVSKKELALLSILVQNAGRVVPKTQLLEEVYSTDKEMDTNTLEVHMHNLRKKINISNFIQTIRGVGYFVQKDKVIK
ncbi:MULTISPECIES: response regulator [Allofrancisella]|uniref:Response regulator transcription factor n=2 Tax=Allofrancisella TaxID=1869285 RepID=A0A6M3HSP7_9GAMM|nr:MULTISPECIES: response regulator transcription factor [Allofrancisella]KEI34697.1 DNA-binding response regulator OmpR [Francisella sp. W12-1067]QIV94100.1 response regulator transcription factor [Allofrancisella frigidaquae]QIV96453.1 response regulator transcription factor [Allofrancisella inopinata]TDT68663.1 two-component system response regulator QseB [Allofrancisella inopinata]